MKTYRTIMRDRECLKEIHVMNDVEWKESVTKHMTHNGWTCDRDDDETLGFSLIEGQYHWIRDYHKVSRRFVHYNGNTGINLVSRVDNTEG